MTWHAGLFRSFMAAVAISCGCLSSHQEVYLGRTDWSRQAWLQGIEDVSSFACYVNNKHCRFIGLVMLWGRVLHPDSTNITVAQSHAGKLDNA